MRHLLPCLFALSLLVGCDGKKPSEQPANGTPKVEAKNEGKKTYKRDELEKSLVGKTEDEVIALIGKPTKTGDGLWTYKELTTDPITNKQDADTWVYFRDGKVSRVSSR